MDINVVRESRYRNIFGKHWRKEVSITNVKPSSGENSIKSNGTYLAFPWASSGAGNLAVVPINFKGKLPDKNPIIDAHPSAIIDFDLHPFREDVVATGSREGDIRLWQVPAEFKANVKDPLLSLKGHSKRLVNICFHPYASDVLLSTSFDLSVRLWDVESGKEAVNIAGHENPPQSVSWCEDGSTFATSSNKDKTLRIFDIRAKTPLIKSTVGHEGAKGFQVSYLDRGRIATVGFHQSQRQISLWDTKDITKPYTTVAIDIDSSILYPYYEPGIGVMFLSGKGNSIYYYEVNSEAPFVHLLNKFQTPTTHSAVGLLPKRVCDFQACEIARFIRLTQTTVETVGFHVPRKNEQYFQEDLYLDVPNNQPSLTAAQFLSGKNGKKITVNLKPKDMVSVFEIPAELGGKNREVIEEKREISSATAETAAIIVAGAASGPGPSETSGQKKGKLMWENRGWFFATFEPRYCTIEDEWARFFLDESSPVSQLSLRHSDVKEVACVLSVPTRFVVIENSGKTHTFDAASPQDRDSWVLAYTNAVTKFLAPKPTVPPTTTTTTATTTTTSSTTKTRSRSVSEKEETVEEEEEEEERADAAVETHEGWLFIQEPGYFFDSWPKRYFVTRNDAAENQPAHFVLVAQESPTAKQIIESFHLNKVLAICKAEAQGTKQHVFKLCTSSQVFHFAAESESARDGWVTALEYRRRRQEVEYQFGSAAGKQLSVDQVESEAEQTEAYLLKLSGGIFGGKWEKFWTTLTGQDLLFFKNNKSLRPFDKLSVQSVKLLSLNERHNDQIDLLLSNGSLCSLRIADPGDERERWARAIESLRRKTIDLLEEMGVDVENLLPAKEIESAPGFVDPTDVKNGKQRLLIQIRGRRRIRIALVDPSCKSLRSGNVFVLDAGQKLFIWNGSNTSRVAKAKGVDVATKLRMKERGGKAKIITLDQDRVDDPEFWQLLGGKAEIKKSDPEEDEIVEQRLYRVTSKQDAAARGRGQLELIHEGSLPPKELLDTRHAYVLHSDHEVYIWVGKSSRSAERQLALNVAKKLSSSRVGYSTIMRVFENGETILFKEKFLNFPGMLPISTVRQVLKSNVAQTVIQQKIDVSKLHHFAPASINYLHGANGKIRVWRIKEFEKVEVPSTHFGEFFSGESYIIHYAYRKGEKDMNAIYFWQGRDSSRNEKGTSACLTVDLADDLGEASQTRVLQNKEDPNFLLIFSQHHYHVRLGKHREISPNSSPSLFEFRGRTPEESHGHQVPLSSSSISALFSFVLEDIQNSRFIVWHGSASNPAQRESANSFARSRSHNARVEEMEEKKTTQTFWQILGGTSYHRLDEPSKLPPESHPRLFLSSTASGMVSIEEIRPFSVDDIELQLHQEHVLILDCWWEIYVWIGQYSFHSERKLVMLAAQEYLANSGVHLPNTKIWVTSHGHEPDNFRRAFRGWTRPVPEATKENLEEALREYVREVFTYEELQADPLPVGVNPRKLETYLSNEEFTQVFGMSRPEFLKLSKWKAENLKRKVNLF